jgi:hypothetical protein
MITVSEHATDGHVDDREVSLRCDARSASNPPASPSAIFMSRGHQYQITAGVYRHFKGKRYEVIGVAPVVDSDEIYVIYRPLYGNRALVLRPYSEFIGTVDRDGREQQRFELTRIRKSFGWGTKLSHLLRGKSFIGFARKELRPATRHQ